MQWAVPAPAEQTSDSIKHQPDLLWERKTVINRREPKPLDALQTTLQTGSDGAHRPAAIFAIAFLAKTVNRREPKAADCRRWTGSDGAHRRLAPWRLRRARRAQSGSGGGVSEPTG